jgi:hypothetical protein
MRKLYLLISVNLIVSVVAIGMSGYTLLRSSEADIAKHSIEELIKKQKDLRNSEIEELKVQIADNSQSQKNQFAEMRAAEKAQDVEIHEHHETLKKIAELLDERLNCPQLAVIEDNTESIANISLNLANLRLQVARDQKKNTAYLPTGSSGFEVLQLPIGNLACSIEDVREYANNSKLTLSIGNPSFAGIIGFEATLRYGPLNDGKIDSEKQKTQKLKILAPLEAGKWFHQEVILEGIKPAELGYLIITDVETSGIRLNTPR